MENQIVPEPNNKIFHKHWAENVGFELLELNTADAGSGIPHAQLHRGGFVQKQELT